MGHGRAHPRMRFTFPRLLSKRNGIKPDTHNEKYVAETAWKKRPRRRTQTGFTRADVNTCIHTKNYEHKVSSGTEKTSNRNNTYRNIYHRNGNSCLIQLSEKLPGGTYYVVQLPTVSRARVKELCRQNGSSSRDLKV